MSEIYSLTDRSWRGILTDMHNGHVAWVYPGLYALFNAIACRLDCGVYRTPDKPAKIVLDKNLSSSLDAQGQDRDACSHAETVQSSTQQCGLWKSIILQREIYIKKNVISVFGTEFCSLPIYLQ